MVAVNKPFTNGRIADLRNHTTHFGKAGDLFYGFDDPGNDRLCVPRRVTLNVSSNRLDIFSSLRRPDYDASHFPRRAFTSPWEMAPSVPARFSPR